MHGAGPAKSKQHELSRIMPSLDRRSADEIAHMRIGNPVNAGRSLDGTHSEGCRSPFGYSACRCFFAEAHFAAEKIIFVQIAQHEIGVRNSRLAASQLIADRPRVGARTLRPNFEDPRLRVDPGDAASSRADRLDPDLGR